MKEQQEDPLELHGMNYIGECLSLNRKKVDRCIQNYEEHLMVTAESWAYNVNTVLLVNTSVVD